VVGNFAFVPRLLGSFALAPWASMAFTTVVSCESVYATRNLNANAPISRRLAVILFCLPPYCKRRESILQSHNNAVSMYVSTENCIQSEERAPVHGPGAGEKLTSLHSSLLQCGSCKGIPGSFAKQPDSNKKKSSPISLPLERACLATWRRTYTVLTTRPHRTDDNATSF
jgi:hypothetical protein